MRRIIGLLAAALAVGVFGGPRPADAAAFLWISAPDWSYSAAAAASPAGTIYFWGLSIGAGTSSFAYAYSTDPPFGAASAVAAATAGIGGAGAAVAVGAADPYADIAIDTPDLGTTLQTTQPSTPTPGTSFTVDTDASDGNIDGITFNTESQSELGDASDELAAILVPTGDLAAEQTDICNAVGDTSCVSSPGNSTQAGDITSIPLLDISLLPLDTLIENGSALTGTWNFGDQANTAGDSVILVAEGNAVPEPGSMLLLGSGLSLLGLIFAGRGRGRREADPA